jgi:hypothetical protein
MALQHLRSSTVNKRPLPAGMSEGQLAINTNLASPGLFLKNSNGDLVKVGPVHVGTTAPNASPAAGGETGNTTGELWLDTSLTPNELKTWDGSAWVSATGQEIPVSKLIDGSARQLLQTDAAGTGVEWTSNVDVPGTLDVTSTATFDSIASHPLGSESAPTITFTGDTNTGIYSPGADQVAISTGGSGRLFVDASGNVGINTSPSSLGSSVTTLEIKGGSTARSGGLRVSSSDSSVKAAFYIYDGAGVLGTESATPLDLYTGNSPRLRITSAGLVGVGTSSPAQILHCTTADGTASQLQFTQQFQREYRIGVPASSTSFEVYDISASASRLTIDSSGRLGVGTTSPGSLLECYGTGVSTAATVNGTGRYRGFEIYASGTRTAYFNDDSTGNIARLWTTRGNLVLGTGDTERLRIDSSGRVGIGTSSPSVELSIAGSDPQLVLWEGSDGASSSKVQLGTGLVQGFINIHKGDGTRTVQISSDDTSYFNGGNVGIGTTSPAGPLHVQGSSDQIRGGDGTHTAFLGASGGNTYTGSLTNAPFLFYTNSQQRAQIDTSGRLLVGTSTSAGGDALQQTSGVGSSTRPKLQLFHWEAGDGAAQLIFSKSRGSSFGSYTVVNSGDELGGLFFQGSNGSAFGTGARIDAVADAAWGSGDHPSRLVFSTTADGASSPTERA